MRIPLVALMGIAATAALVVAMHQAASAQPTGLCSDKPIIAFNGAVTIDSAAPVSGDHRITARMEDGW